MSDKRFTGNLSNYEERFLDCRENHLWQWVTDWNIVRSTRGGLVEFSRLKRCPRCGAEANRVYDGRTGRVKSTSYRYPDGYLSSKENRFHAGDARLESIRRTGRIVQEGSDG